MGATFVIADDINIVSADGTIVDRFCISLTFSNAGVVSMEGIDGSGQLKLCMVMRNAEGGGVEFSWYGDATCHTDDTDFLHSVPGFVVSSTQPNADCPAGLAPLGGADIIGWGTEAPREPGSYQSGYSPQGYFTLPLVNTAGWFTLWSITVCAASATQVRVPGSDVVVWQMVAEGTSATCLGWGCCAWGWSVPSPDGNPDNATGYFKSSAGHSRTDCPTNTTILANDPDAYTLYPWWAGYPGPVPSNTPTPSPTRTGTPTASSTASSSVTGTSSPTSTPTSSITPSLSVTGSPYPTNPGLGLGAGTIALLAGGAVGILGVVGAGSWMAGRSSLRWGRVREGAEPLLTASEQA